MPLSSSGVDSPSSWERAASRTRLSKTWPIRGGRSAIRHPLRSNGSISTVRSRSGTPPPGTGKRSCNASPKPPVRGHLCPSPRAFVLREARNRSTWPAPACGCRIRRVLHALLRPRPPCPPHMDVLVEPSIVRDKEIDPPWASTCRSMTTNQSRASAPVDGLISRKTGPPSPTSSRQRSRIGAETLEGVQLTSTSR